MDNKALNTITLNKLTRLHLGKRIRKVRKNRRQSLQALATKIGVSRSLLSQIESGKANPSLNTLWSLADALEVHVTTLLKNEQNEKLIVEPAQIKDLSKRIKCYVLSPQATTDFEFAYVEYLPGGSSGDLPAHHSGREYFLVIEGKIEATVDSQTFILTKDNSITFSGRLPHSMKNIGKTKARALFLIIPDE